MVDLAAIDTSLPGPEGQGYSPYRVVSNYREWFKKSADLPAVGLVIVVDMMSRLQKGKSRSAQKVDEGLNIL
jgi:hypothetical protein